MARVFRARRPAAIVLLLAALVFSGGALIDLLRWRTVYSSNRGLEQSATFGRVQISRFGSIQTQRDSMFWYVETGFLAHQLTHDPLVETVWRLDGRVAEQWLNHEPVPGPPWANGIGDQEAPSAPWIETGESPEDWFESVFVEW